MAGKTYLLDVAAWEKYGFINSNIDQTKLKPIIDRVQRNRIEPILGTTLFDKVITDVDAGTITGLYKTLLDDYVRPTMIAYCDHKATFHTTSQITNKTTGKNKDQHIEANSTEDNNNLRDELIKDADQFKRKMIGWLQDNKNDIPEYCDTETDKSHQSIKPSGNSGTYLETFTIV